MKKNTFLAGLLAAILISCVPVWAQMDRNAVAQVVADLGLIEAIDRAGHPDRIASIVDSMGLIRAIERVDARAAAALKAARRPATPSTDGVGYEYARLVFWRAALAATTTGTDSVAAANGSIWTTFIAGGKATAPRRAHDKEAAAAIFAAANRPNVVAGLDTAAVLALVRAELAPIRAELADTRAVADSAATKADLRRLAVLTATALGAVKPANATGKRTLASCMNDMRAAF